MSESLHAPAALLAALLPGRFVKLEPHDAAERESVDLLWLESTPEDAFSEGMVLSVEPADEAQTVWSCSLDFAYRFGGWSTIWSLTGTHDEVVARVQAALDRQSAG